jgi:hypothetical protein
MSFLFKKVAAQDGNSEFIIEHSRIPIAQLGGEENAKKSGYIIAKKNGRTYGVHIDGYSDELTRRTLKDAGYAFDGCEGKDAAEFKVGDKVKITIGGGNTGKVGIVKKVERTSPISDVTYLVQIDGKGLFPINEGGVVAADSAAMDDLNDGIKTIENKARALIADAKNARSKYADILARSEIAKNNAQVKKTFEDDIARCDKLINALKAI